MGRSEVVERLRLRRIGDGGAQVGMVSLPLPRAGAGQLGIDHPRAALLPVAWWEKDSLPRRAIAYILDDHGVPESVRLTSAPRPAPAPSAAWQIQSRVTVERRQFVSRIFKGIDQLRGQPAAECATFQGEVTLRYGQLQLALQAGATGPRGDGSGAGGGPYWWENVQVDHLWANAVAQAVRLGGVIYNEDTYLWADLYLVLFANGVADVAAHFVNTKLHIKGYDFQGLPVLRLGCPGLGHETRLVPAEGTAVAAGPLRLNVADAAHLCSAEHPARLECRGEELRYHPFARVVNPHEPDGAPASWTPGLARTVRFQFSLGDAPPVIARYTVPAWWYARSDEPCPGGYLPVAGRCSPFPRRFAAKTRAAMVRGRFDAPGCKPAHEGYAGSGLMLQFYQHGEPAVFADALDYCYYWADVWVDHTDFTVWQGRVGAPWKTCAYTQFRDILFGYLETGDPYLLDTAEMVAETYWAWYRSNWPRASIGRDNFELGAWALLWRFRRTAHARDRTRELVRMTLAVLASRGNVGGQTGAGPHPGHRPSLFLTGVTMIGLLEAAEAALEAGEAGLAAEIARALGVLHRHFIREDIEMLPFVLARDRLPVGTSYFDASRRLWRLMALRLYAELARCPGHDPAVPADGLRHALAGLEEPPGAWDHMSRSQTAYASAPVADALLAGARADDDGLWLEPAGLLEFWPAEQTVATPWGSLRIRCAAEANGWRLQFSAAEPFTVRVRIGGTIHTATSRDELLIPPGGLPPRILPATIATEAPARDP